MQNVTPENYRSFVTDTEKTVVLDYWATWCGPCMMLAPIMEELEAEYPQIQFGKVNVDEAGELAAEAMVDSIPTLIVYKGGKEARRFVGWRPKEELQKELEALI